MRKGVTFTSSLWQMLQNIFVSCGGSTNLPPSPSLKKEGHKRSPTCASWQVQHFPKRALLSCLYPDDWAIEFLVRKPFDLNHHLEETSCELSSPIYLRALWRSQRKQPAQSRQNNTEEGMFASNQISSMPLCQRSSQLCRSVEQSMMNMLHINKRRANRRERKPWDRAPKSITSAKN